MSALVPSFGAAACTIENTAATQSIPFASRDFDSLYIFLHLIFPERTRAPGSRLSSRRTPRHDFITWLAFSVARTGKGLAESANRAPRFRVRTHTVKSPKEKSQAILSVFYPREGVRTA